MNIVWSGHLIGTFYGYKPTERVLFARLTQEPQIACLR
jgi:hypothetical protein